MARRSKGGKQAGHHVNGVPADHQPKMRTRLGGCGQVFWSQGPANRVCARCANAARGRLLSRTEAAGPLRGV